jgi:hypothetical protein
MRLKELKDLIKKSMVEVAPKTASGAMTPEEEIMVADYEEEEANKYALDKEEPLEEEKKYYITMKSKDGKGGGTLQNLPNHIHNTYSGALRSIEYLRDNFKKGKKYTYYVSDIDGNPITQGKEIEEASVILNRDEVYAKYAPLVKQYMENGLDKYAAISKAEDVLAREYGATPLNIQSTISDYFDDQYRNSTYANENVLREADDIVAAYAEKQTLKEEMHGGYLELLEMNPDFENGARLLLNAWFEWKEGPMTEPQMVDEARQDILAYLSSMMR